MINRYTRPEMGDIWSEDNKYRAWLKVEIAACRAQEQLGRIPQGTTRSIEEKANFSVDRILEIEAQVKHDVIAFLTNVGEYVGPESRFIHLGMTSSDLLDTALALVTRQAAHLIEQDLLTLLTVLKRQALTHKLTVCVGRSHGIHAEPTSFGLKFALWYDEMNRNLARLQAAINAISVGMVSGVVGTFAFIDPQVEEMVCRELDLSPAPVSTQVIQRDLHAQFINTLAMIGCTMEKIAIEIRHLQRTEVLEAEEPFSKGQKGSSAMPHKRNPIGSENITGLARLLRANALAAYENIALWHERDISHSSVERVIFPDSCILTDYMLNRLTKILDNLVVYPENMLKNLHITKGLIFSQPLLLALTESGMSREEAYKIVQENAMKCWQEGLDFKTVIGADELVLKFLTLATIESCFDEKHALKHVDYIFNRLNIQE
ncbi:MAG TPA: adenylosuccinate lyase [bacterium]|nr:adenylosuccinate lyase [bacterium]HPN43624.1 adenylosuccinate lyase [bacterium]